MADYRSLVVSEPIFSTTTTRPMPVGMVTEIAGHITKALHGHLNLFELAREVLTKSATTGFCCDVARRRPCAAGETEWGRRSNGLE
jgi:hypothetical protein